MRVNYIARLKLSGMNSHRYQARKTPIAVAVNAVRARKQTETRARGVRVCASESDAIGCGCGRGERESHGPVSKCNGDSNLAL